LLLVGAVLILSVPQPHTGIWWIPVGLGNSDVYAPFPNNFILSSIVISIVTVALFLGWTTPRSPVRDILADSNSNGSGWVFWLLACVATIAGLRALLGIGAGNGITNLVYISATGILILVAVASWGLAAMPLQFWSHWIRFNPRVLPFAVTAGVLTYIGGHHFTRLVLASFEGLTGGLQRATLSVVAVLLHLITRDVVFKPQDNLIGTQYFSVYVDVPCGGWEGIGMFCTLFGMYLWFYRRELRYPAVLTLLPLGAAILWLLNALRLVVLVLLGNWSATAAVEGFHSVAGWLFFDAVTLILVATSRHLRLFAKAPIANKHDCHAIANPAVPFLLPLIAIIATSMIARVFFFRFDLFYPLRTAVGAVVLGLYSYRLSLRWHVSPSAVGLGLIAFAIWILLQKSNDASSSASLSLGLNNLSPVGRGLWILSRAFGAIVVIPIAEELAFRGYLLRKLIRSDFEAVPYGQFTWFSFLGCSLIFGLLHTSRLAGCLAGMIFAVAVYRRGLLSDAIVSHGVANAMLALYVLTTREWFLWSN
jgi:exosortase E/protease (VPEID-CTERM system)